MIRRWLLLAQIITMVTMTAAVARADTAPFEFDLFESENQLQVQLDLSSLLSAEQVEQLLQGIEFAIEYKITLRSPRRFYGSTKITESTGHLKIGYRLATEDFEVSCLINSLESVRSVLSQGRLHRFCSDSIIADLTDIDQLQSGQKYYIELKLTAITLTTLNLTPDFDPPESTNSPIRFLFEQFLILTDYGRKNYELKSRHFSREEILPRSD